MHKNISVEQFEKECVGCKHEENGRKLIAFYKAVGELAEEHGITELFILMAIDKCCAMKVEGGLDIVATAAEQSLELIMKEELMYGRQTVGNA